VNFRRNAERARDVVSAAEAAGARAVAIPGDMTQLEQVEQVFDEAERQLGAVSAVVYSAGITGRAARLVDADPDVIRETIDVNVMGALWCCQVAARRMAKAADGKRRGGAIVLLSSGAATLGSAGEFVWYAASKGAVDSLTIGLSKELAQDGIRVNAVSPGLTETELHALSTGEPGRIARMAPSIPMGRAAAPEEVAEPILWLLSDAASYVSGAIVRVAGGR
jgi:NAD(P)-dependent dehydrogenase (short-subunit alcohol dehydrogenase family)